MSLILQPAAIVLLLAMILLLYILHYDYRHLKIQNRSVLLLLGLYLVLAALTGFYSVLSDVAAGLVLFLPSFMMWLFRLMGAGDAKLYFGLGLFIGFNGLGVFAVLLLIFTLLVLAALYFVKFSSRTTGPIGRFKQMKSSGHVPYAMIMCSAAVPAIALRIAELT